MVSRRDCSLCQSPRLFLGDVAIGLSNEGPNRIESAIERVCPQMSRDRFRELDCAVKEAVVFHMSFGRRWYDAAAITLDHAKHPMRQIAELPGKFGFVGLPEAPAREV